MRLNIRHRTLYKYEPGAMRVALRMKLFPSITETQTVKSWTVSVNGEPPSSQIINGYGDQEAIWIAQNGAESVEVLAEGEVHTRDASGLLKGWKMAARPAVFLRETPLTKVNDAIMALGAEAPGSGVDWAHGLSHAVREAVDYEAGATSSMTTASEALRRGAGVCQDHAHILIAAARTQGVPARYVVGYLFVGEGDQEELSQEAETHAWTELWIKDLGWVGFDPSNRVCPTDHYVRVAAGLDAADAAPLRGAVLGATEETLEAEVQVVQAQQ